MKLTLSFHKEADSSGDGFLLRGRWVCEVAETKTVAYGTSEADAAANAVKIVVQTMERQ